MSYEKQPLPMNGYQQTEFIPTQHPQGLTQAPEIYPDLPAEAASSPNRDCEGKDDDAASVQGIGEPGYIPDTALNVSNH